jgi:hypothetical protein
MKPQRKFKVGDKVVCSNPHPSCNGRRFVVVDIWGGKHEIYMVKDDKGFYNFLGQHLTGEIK